MASRKIAQLIDINKPSWLAIAYLLGLPMVGLLLSGCAMVTPDYSQPALPMLSASYQMRDSQLQPAVDLDSWWHSFADPTLNQLASRALANNLTVQIAVERIVEARANVTMESRRLLPNVGMNCELDLFDRHKRSQQVAEAELLANEYSLQNAQQALVADVATSYLMIRLLQNQIEIVDQSLQLQQATTTQVSGRAKAGVVTKIDAEQSVAFLHRTRAERAVLESQLDAEFNRLGILLGESPSPSLRGFVGFGQLPSAPYLPVAGIPADLIRRRPDIRQAEAEVVAATARIGIAKADLHPRFRLSGFLSPLSGDALPFGGNLFNSGRVQDNIDIHESRLRQAVGNYRVVVLNAVKEVEDSMAKFDGHQKQSVELERALQSDSKAVELSLQRYEMGKSDFQRVIDIQMQMLEDSQASAASRAKASVQLVNLYNSLGGGMPPQVSVVPQQQQVAGASCGCAECMTSHQDDYLGGCWSSDPSAQQSEFQGDTSYINQAPPTIQGQPAIQPDGSQLISSPEHKDHSILQSEDFGPIDFNPNFSQLPQQIPAEVEGRNVMAEMFDWEEQNASGPQDVGQNQQILNSFTHDKISAEMFDWDKDDAAVVKSLQQKPSSAGSVMPAGYFADSLRENNKRNTPKSSSIKRAPMVWDSEAAKVD